MMATTNDCPEATRVLLVDPQSLPVLLQGNPQAHAVDLLQQALQGTSAIDDGDDVGAAEEVSLGADALSSSNSNDVVAIYQGGEGQTHTIKISLAEAESLGLRFYDDRSAVSLNSGTLVNGMKVAPIGEHLAEERSGACQGVSLGNDNLLQDVACSNLTTEGRMIDEEGNIVEASGSLQILPSLTSLLEEGVSIIPQYELDGSVTYAVRLKDQSDAVLGTDYHVLEPDSSAKTGLDIEEELKNSNLKQNILPSQASIALGGSMTLNTDSNSISSSIQVPINAFEALSKQMLLPVSSTSVPISVTLPISSVSSHTPITSSNSLAAASNGRIFQLVTDRSSVGMNNLIANGAAAASLNSLLPQPLVAGSGQHSQLINPSSALLNLQGAAPVTLLSHKNIAPAGPRPPILGTKLSGLLSSSKNVPMSTMKPVASLKKIPLNSNVASPVSAVSPPVLLPAVASVAPNTAPAGAGNVSKSEVFTNGRGSVLNSSKPLGSSENPIQLVQQGQTFHSMQALSEAQLRQIATVLQQKHLNSNSSASKNVLFDEQTKTRIVYRVVYPEDVDLQQPVSPNDKTRASSMYQSGTSTNTVRRRRGRPKRGRRAKQPLTEKSVVKMEQTTQLLEGQNSVTTEVKTNEKEEDLSHDPPKVEKKKILGSRTRSGRVSRPPKHMMKDYKRLHHIDYKEKDVDDSDGGYSDYSSPEQSPEKPPDKPLVNQVETDVAPAKKRMSRFSCPTCKKLYLGLGRMEKHFIQHPDHGSFEEFKQLLSAQEEAAGNTESKPSSSKGKKRSQGPNVSDQERSDNRKKKLRQALQACELSEVIHVAGPLIAKYCSLWDLLLLRLRAIDESTDEKGTSGNLLSTQKQVNGNEGSFVHCDLDAFKNSNSFPLLENEGVNSQRDRSAKNRVQWLLLELGALAGTLQSLASDLFKPAHMNEDKKGHVEINEKTVSELFGMRCGLYAVNEAPLLEKINSFAPDLQPKINAHIDAPPEKRSRQDSGDDLSSSLNDKESDMCHESLPNILNTSYDMICGSEDPDLSSDSKRDQDSDTATGIRVVDEIVKERLKNLSDNLSFSVQLQGSLDTSDLKEQESEIHLISSFERSENSLAVSNTSVLSGGLTEENKSSVNVANMDLISSYSISSLSSSVTSSHDVNISNNGSSNDLSSALEPVTSQSMLGSFAMGLSSLGSFDALQSQSANVPHSEDSFLESLSSFETPLTQSCDTSNTTGTAYDDSMIKNSAMLELENDSSAPSQLPPKFISSFTPAVTNDKVSTSISTAQRLQRTYLDLDSGLDDGLDLDFEALTEELSMNRNNRL